MLRSRHSTRIRAVKSSTHCGGGTLDDNLTWGMDRFFTTEILEALAANGRATREAQDRDEREPDHNRSSRFSIRTAASPGS